MAAVTAQRDIDLLNMSHIKTMFEESQDAVRGQVQEAQIYRQEITSYMSEAAQLNQNLQHMTQLNEHSGQAQAASDWTLRTELQAANKELSLSETREVSNLTNLARVQGDLDSLRMRVATEEQPALELTGPRPISTQLWPSPADVALLPLPPVPQSLLWGKLGISTSKASSTSCIAGFIECAPTSTSSSTQRLTNSRAHKEQEDPALHHHHHQVHLVPIVGGYTTPRRPTGGNPDPDGSPESDPGTMTKGDGQVLKFPKDLNQHKNKL
eukprot:4150056-Amphidinium_carterae.1